MLKENMDKTPLYCRLADSLRNQIFEGKYKVGDRMPSERELCDKYSVSRMTVRLAIAELVRDGQIQKIQGKGTYVQQEPIVQDMNNVYSFSKEMDRQGKINSTKVVTKAVLDADEKLARKLGIHEGDSIIYLERLRYSDKEAIIVEKSWFPYEDFDYLMDCDLSKGLYKTLEEDHDTPIDEADEVLQATVLNQRECSLLNCPPGQYGIMVERLAYCRKKPVSYSIIVSYGSTLEFKIHLQG